MNDTVRRARRATIGSVSDTDSASVRVTESTDLQTITIEITGRAGTPDMDLLSGFTTKSCEEGLCAKATISMRTWVRLMGAGEFVGKPKSSE